MVIIYHIIPNCNITIPKLMSIGEGVALKFSDIEYGKIAIKRMEDKVHVFDGERFKSADVQIVEHLKRKTSRNTALFLLLT
jgi:hypothetical protein